MDQDRKLERMVENQAVENEAVAYAANDACQPPPRVSDQFGLRQFRVSKRESQATFWARFGVTQSSGSRFETGLGVPPPVALLVKLYINGKLSDGDLLA